MDMEQSVRRYRSKHEITATILSLLSKGDLIKTKVMYGAYLSADQLKQYIEILTENELVEFKENKIHLTEAGLKWLKAFKSVNLANAEKEQGARA